MIRVTFILLCVIFMFSCKKDDNSISQDPTPFSYTSLTTADSLIVINGTTQVTAVASGDDLTYTWTYTAGAIIGSGAIVDYTVCHSGTFKVSCEVKDKYDHSETKYVTIKAH